MGNASRFQVGDWTVTPSLNLLEQAGESITIESRPMDVLVCLANHAPETVSLDDLIREAWRGRVVSDSSIYLVISQLRNAFGHELPEVIETIRNRGYRLALPVEFLPESIAFRDQSRIQSVLRKRRRLAATSALAIILLATTAVYVSPWSPLHMS